MLTLLERRIIDISYKKKLSHISSCLTAVDIVDRIYSLKKENDIFILSSGHCALALYCVLEKYYNYDAEELFEEHGVHPVRNLRDKIFCSTGSLGQGITVAVGMALAEKNQQVYVVISDGESNEGSCWEALRIAEEQKLHNLHVYVNANSACAYANMDIDLLQKRLDTFFPTTVVRTSTDKFPTWLRGYDGHYVVLDQEKYNDLIS